MADWVRVASLDEFPAGGLRGVEVGENRIVLARVNGEIYALQDQCSHANFPLSDGELDGTELECIHHGAKFDVTSGKAIQFPAIRPVRSFPVEIRDADVFVRVE